MKVPIESIKVPERFRQDLGNIDELAEKIAKTKGNFVTVWVDADMNLIAGFRRLSACKKLGYTEVDVKVGDGLDELDRRELELEENVVRKDMTPLEKVNAVTEIHRLYMKKYGHVSAGQTAKRIGMSEANTYIHLQVSEAAKIKPTVAEKLNKEGVSAAYRQMLFEQEREVQAELAKVTVMAPAPLVEGSTEDEQLSAQSAEKAKDMLWLGDSTDLIKTIPDGSIDLVYTDPEYGVDLSKLFAKGGAFAGNVYEKDTPEKFQSLISTLAPEWFRVLHADGWVFLWMSFQPDLQHYVKLVMESAGFTYRNPPFIWVKEGGSHACYAPTIQFASGCDVALLFSKGTPIMLKQGQPNYSTCPQVPAMLKFHPAERPVDLGCQIIPIFAHARMKVLDTFAGSASSLKSCFKLGIEAIGMEIDEKYHNAAVLSLTDFIKDQLKPVAPLTAMSPASMLDEATVQMLTFLGWSPEQVAKINEISAARIFEEELTPEKCSILPDGTVFVIPTTNSESETVK